MKQAMSRRQLLRGLGAAIALPALEAMGRPRGEAPVRLVWIHTESGMWMERYKPAAAGPGFELTPTLDPLAPFRSELTVLSGLFHANAFRRNPQAGRHAQDAICHLTGADLGAVSGVAVRNTVSIDQLLAGRVGEKTRIPVLNLSPQRHGYLSFTDSGAGVPNQWNPPDLFSLLFEDRSPEARKLGELRFRQNRSVLDAVMESTKDLQRDLGASDRRTVDEYLTNLREVERRSVVARRWAEAPAAAAPEGAKRPGNAPEKDRTAHLKVLLDQLVLALQTDQTRLATLQIGFMGCRYPDLGLSDSYHGYTHHDNKPDKQAAMAMIDRHRIALLAYLLERLRAVKENGKDLLHSCAIHYGGGMGSWHESTDLANLVVGRAGGRLKPGAHLDCKGKPLANLYVRLASLAGVDLKGFADSTGPLEGW